MYKLILILFTFFNLHSNTKIRIEKYNKFFSCPFETIETKDSIFLTSISKKYFSASVNKFNYIKVYSGLKSDTLLIKTVLALNKKTNKGIATCFTFGNSFPKFDTNGFLVETYGVYSINCVKNNKFDTIWQKKNNNLITKASKKKR